jgi:hypothetical protein
MRLSELETKIGRRLGQRRQEVRGKATAADRWFRERIGGNHPEQLDGVETDLLGSALMCEQRGDIAGGQQYMDLLQEHHELRMSLKRVKSGRMPPVRKLG